MSVWAVSFLRDVRMWLHQRREEFRQSSVSFKMLSLFCRLHLLQLLLFTSKYKLTYGSRAEITQATSKYLTTMQVEGPLLVKGIKCKSSKCQWIWCLWDGVWSESSRLRHFWIFPMLREIAKGAQDAAHDLSYGPWLFSIEIYSNIEGYCLCRFHWNCTAFLSDKSEILLSVFILHAFF